MEKTQTVSYTGKGYFVVDLDDLTKENIIEDKKNKTITIQINHAHLETVEIDPSQVIIDDVKESLLAKGRHTTFGWTMSCAVPMSTAVTDAPNAAAI